MGSHSSDCDAKLLAGIVNICCWRVIDLYNRRLFTLFNPQEAAHTQIVEGFFRIDYPLVLNGMGMWVNMGLRQVLLEPGSVAHGIFTKLKFVVVGKITDLCCGDCTAAYGLRLASRGASWSEAMRNGRGADGLCTTGSGKSMVCNCRKLLTSPARLVGDCSVCLDEQTELVKFSTCIHAVCDSCMIRLAGTQCPECRTPLAHGCAAVNVTQMIGPRKWTRTVANVGTQAAHRVLCAIGDDTGSPAFHTYERLLNQELGSRGLLRDSTAM